MTRMHMHERRDEVLLYKAYFVSVPPTPRRNTNV
jgi:hypothetical protein